ncbi:hypothetical protein GCM10022395_24090 [Snuella lapsa]|uniref:Peptidase M48 domain-containing protein n=1 Tax=Snuella lapsa TaxID=870481 RepID=A0ABP6XYI6_9FLAO
MKVGSYVYNVNQIIFNMLYDNESYDKIIQGWANVSGYFSIFVVLAVKVVEAIQWVLNKLYEVVNKSYMALSREMEFHADEIAAHITGYKPLKSALLRMPLADHAYDSVLAFYEAKIEHNQKSNNLFKEHAFVMHFLAKDSNTQIENNLPKITIEELNKYNKSKLIIKDQWSSHPSTEDRINRLEKINIVINDTDNTPANTIFQDIEKTQNNLTSLAFKDVKYEEEAKPLLFTDFQAEYEKDYFNNTFSKIYNGYYDNKNPMPFDVDTIDYIQNLYTITELFSDKKVDLVYTAFALQNDIETIKQIAERAIPVKTFDYDGKKYKRSESKKLLRKLNSEIEKLNEQIKENDINIFKFFSRCEYTQKRSNKLTDYYKALFSYDQTFDKNYEVYTQLSEQLHFITVTTPYDDIKANFLGIQPLEKKLKDGITSILNDTKYQKEITKAMRDNFNLYLSKQWLYFGNQNYFDDNLEILFTAMNNYAFLLSKGYFILKKKLLTYQKELVKEQNLELMSQSDKQSI